MKVLFLTMGDCFHAPKDGGGQCNARNYRFLQQLYGAQNVFAACFTDDAPPAVPGVHYLPQNTNRLVRLTSALTGRLECKADGQRQAITLFRQLACEAVFLDSLCGSWIGRFRKAAPGVKILFFAINLDVEYYRLRVEKEGRHILPIYWGVRRNERAAVRQADWFATLTDRDDRGFLQTYSRSADVVLPMSFADRFDAAQLPAAGKSAVEEKRLLFIGSLFAANLDGAAWFVREVLPLLPQYRLTIVGKGFERERQALENPQVEVVGTVEDLAPYYYRHPVLVLPIRYGAGVKIKTAEAIMYGRTIFATDEALEGYEADGVEGIFRCNTPAEFAREIESFFARPGPLPAFQPAVRQLFLNRHEDSMVCRKMKQSLQAKHLLPEKV